MGIVLIVVVEPHVSLKLRASLGDSPHVSLKLRASLGDRYACFDNSAM